MMITEQTKGISLLWRILVSTSLAVTLVFALTGWMVQRYAGSVSERSLEEEVRMSLQAYETLWRARVHNLTAISRIISSMSDVRAALGTGDRATIRDTAQQLWSQVSEQDATFLVLDPTGAVITSLGGDPDFSVGAPLMRVARQRFPNQVSGYVRRSAHLYYLVFTPVYVQAEDGQALINVLLVAFDINNQLARTLKDSTHGSDFAFVGSDSVFASTLPLVSPSHLMSDQDVPSHVRRLNLHGADYLLLGTDLRDPSNESIGKLFIIRSFVGQEAVLTGLQRNVGVFWSVAIVLAVVLTYLLSKRILNPVKRLDRAAAEVIRRNYDYRVPVETHDELGRLALTFNAMCDSIRSARQDLIRQEQIATIGRLSSSIVHDLRNPLAAIYGGAEMLVDTELSPEQCHRLASNIYSASRRIQELLQDLVDVSRAKTRPIEICRLVDLATSAYDAIARAAEAQSVDISIDIPQQIEVSVDRDRLERVFLNLMNNALDAMQAGGAVRIVARAEVRSVKVEIEDTGPGIPEEAWPTLFQPFASFRKKNGLGLGLALSRQTLLDHGGELWAEKKVTQGARFLMRLPLSSTAVSALTVNHPAVSA